MLKKLDEYKTLVELFRDMYTENAFLACQFAELIILEMTRKMPSGKEKKEIKSYYELWKRNVKCLGDM